MEGKLCREDEFPSSELYLYMYMHMYMCLLIEKLHDKDDDDVDDDDNCWCACIAGTVGMAEMDGWDKLITAWTRGHVRQ